MREDCLNTIAADVTAHFGNDPAASSAVSNVAQAEVADANGDANEAEVDANVEKPETVIDAEQADIIALNELINPDEEKTNVET